MSELTETDLVMTSTDDARPMISAHYGPGGSLSVDELPPELDGQLQELPALAAVFYGGRYLIAESMSIHTARAIAKALGLTLTLEETK